MAEKGAKPAAKPRPKRRGRASGFPIPDGSDAVLSLTGKHLPHAALATVLRAIPDELVREITAASAPLTRYSGRSRIGAAALSRGLKLLAQPPPARQPIARHMNAAEIG